jgi:hypoxanthine phosphoribosyltransferase
MRYTRVAGLLRGGLHTTNIVSRMLCMEANQVVGLSVSKYTLKQKDRHDQTISVGQVPERPLIEGQSVLLIDDLVRTGETAHVAETILMGLGAEAVDLAVLYDKSANFNAIRKPDFFVATTDLNVEFPWQTFDTPKAF